VRGTDIKLAECFDIAIKIFFCLRKVPAMIYLFYAFFWVINWRLWFKYLRHFGTLCIFVLHRRVHTYTSAKMEQCVPKRWLTTRRKFDMKNGLVSNIELAY
jgi:hypothetical protein